MDNKGHIVIRVTGKKGNLDLTPDNLDIKDIIGVLGQVEGLLFPNEMSSRPILSYSLEEGSVRHVFTTSMQVVIGFNALLGQIYSTKSIDFLDLPTAQAIESFQTVALKGDYSLSLSTSLPETSELRIDSSTHFFRDADVWADAEFYFYGKLTNAGGKEKANIHIQTDDLGVVRIATPIEFLERQESNILYKPYGVRATGRQHMQTGEIDKASLTFVEIIDYTANFDETYLNRLRGKSGWLKAIEPEAWLNEIRGTHA